MNISYHVMESAIRAGLVVNVFQRNGSRAAVLVVPFEAGPGRVDVVSGRRMARVAAPLPRRRVTGDKFGNGFRFDQIVGGGRFLLVQAFGCRSSRFDTFDRRR